MIISIKKDVNYETITKQTCFERLKLKMNIYQIGNNRSKSNVSKSH